MKGIKTFTAEYNKVRVKNQATLANETIEAYTRFEKHDLASQIFQVMSDTDKS